MSAPVPVPKTALGTRRREGVTALLRGCLRGFASSLARRLILGIVLFSSVITLVLTVYQLHGEYVRDVRSLEARLDEIRLAQLGAISTQLWELNDEILGETLDGLVRLPDVYFLQVLSDDGFVQSAGVRPDTEVLERHYPIQYNFRGEPLHLGTLRVMTSLTPARERLVSRIGSTVLSNGLKTFLVTAFAIGLIHLLVIRRLGAIRRFCRAYAVGSPAGAPALPPPRRARQDELDDVTDAIRTMLRRIESGYDDLQASERRYRRIIETAEEGIWMIDRDAITTFVNAKLGRMLGREPETMHGRPIFDFMDEAGAAAARFGLERARSGQREPQELRLLHAEGRAIWVLMSISPIVEDDGSDAGTLAMITDIDQRKRAEAQVSRLAYYDALTELPNRGFLVRRLGEALARSERHGQYGALLFLDLDHFKNVNDSSGHFAGDALLRELAVRLRDAVREEDTVSRFGGDEFVVLLAELDGDDEAAAACCKTIAEKLIETISRPVEVDRREMRISASVGIALFDGDETPEDVLRNADAALYRAKDQGRGCATFYRDEMREAARYRLTLEKGLREALANDDIQIVYQPIVAADGGRIIGVEALSRWTHPEEGPIPPDVFIRVAEESGLIHELGAHCLITACREIGPVLRAQELGLEHGLAVNTSPHELLDPRLPERVAFALESTGIPPERLQLEITEGSVIHDTVRATQHMAAIRALGVGFAVDDFGTGYSSLSYLKRLPLRVLKIDRSFVHDLASNTDDAAIVDTILAIAGHFDLTVVAEGVETESHLQALTARGCTAFQGYYFAHPMPLADLLRRLRHES